MRTYDKAQVAGRVPAAHGLSWVRLKAMRALWNQNHLLNGKRGVATTLSKSL